MSAINGPNDYVSTLLIVQRLTVRESRFQVFIIRVQKKYFLIPQATYRSVD